MQEQQINIQSEPMAEIESAPEMKPMKTEFEVEDVCIVRTKVMRSFGALPEKQPVEIIRKFQKDGEPRYDVRTLACKSCDLIITFKNIEGQHLQDYDEVFPAT